MLVGIKRIRQIWTTYSYHKLKLDNSQIKFIDFKFIQHDKYCAKEAFHSLVNLRSRPILQNGIDCYKRILYNVLQVSDGKEVDAAGMLIRLHRSSMSPLKP